MPKKYLLPAVIAVVTVVVLAKSGTLRKLGA